MTHVTVIQRLFYVRNYDVKNPVDENIYAHHDAKYEKPVEF